MTDEHVAPRKAGRPRLLTPVFLLVTFATFSYFVGIGVLLPTLPRYVEGPLGGGSTAVGLSIGSFSLAAVLLRPFVGRLGDRRGRRLLVVVGGGAVGLSAISYVFADSVSSLILLRLIAGAGEGFFYVGAASVINDIAPEERRGEAMSYFSLALYTGLAVGPVLGEAALGDGRFRLVWVVAAAAAFVAAVSGLRLPDTRPAEDERGHGRSSGKYVHRAALIPGIVLATSVWGFAGFSTFVPLYALRLGLDGSDMVFVVYSAVVLTIRSAGARIPDLLGPRTTARVALVCAAVGLGLIGLWAQPSGLFVGAAIAAAGQALSFPALMTIAVRGAPRAERASVIATFTAFFDLAFGLGAVTLGGVASVLGYRGLFLTAAGIAGAGLLLLVVRARRGAARQPAEAVSATADS